MSKADDWLVKPCRFVGPFIKSRIRPDYLRFLKSYISAANPIGDEDSGSMNNETATELKTLLENALSSVEINQGSNSRILSLQTYARKLRQIREVYDPALRWEVLSYDIAIANQEIREKILLFIKRELSEFIQEDRIQSAAGELTIGYGGGFPVEMVLDKILEIAIRNGIEDAVWGFEELVKNSSGAYHFVILLNGLRVEKEIEIFSGARLVPMPTSPSELPSFLSELGHSPPHFPSVYDFVSKTMVIVDFSVSPLLVNPSSYPWDGKGASPFQRESESNLATHLDGDVFCQALSMACNAPIQPLAWWRQIDNDQMYNISGHSIDALTKSVQADRVSTSAPATQTEIDEAVRIYRKLTEWDAKTKNSLNVAISRWIKSMTDEVQVDKMIDLGIAFESLFLSDSGGNSGEIRYRFSLRGAYLMAEGGEEREAMFNEFKSIYNARSRAVHKGQFSGRLKVHGRTVPEHAFVKHAQDLCLMTLMKVVDDGKFPVWDELVLGN